MTKQEIIIAINDIIFSLNPDSDILDIIDELNDLIDAIREEEND